MPMLSSAPRQLLHFLYRAIESSLGTRGQFLADAHVFDRDGQPPGLGRAPEDIAGQRQHHARVGGVRHELRRGRRFEQAKPHLARFKLPKEIHFIRAEEMPRNATGKILHRKLREKFGA